MTENINHIQVSLIQALQRDGQLPDDLEEALVEFIESGRAALFRAFMEGNWTEAKDVARVMEINMVLEHYRLEANRFGGNI